MNPDFLDFEQPIAELDAKIRELRHMGAESDLDLDTEIERLQGRRQALAEDIFSNLSAWQVTQLARHPQRPYTRDYLPHLFSEFHELHGDQAYADDQAILAGMARLDSTPVMVIGHQKGRDTKEKLEHNFGMPRPEGYRKARRLMQMAERFRMPIITFIDTPGAYPGIGAEERGQSEAIARNLEIMTELRVPIISVVIGEGGSGGALAIGVSDHLMMLQYSIYSVISPEGCSSILWKSADKAQEAAEALGLTSERLKQLELIDEIVEEPLGGAHRDLEAMSTTLKQALAKSLAELGALDPVALVDRREDRLLQVGMYQT